MKYKAPLTKDNRIQHVPCVTKNKDMLIGSIDAFLDILSSLSEVVDLKDPEIMSRIFPRLDSSRFNGYIDDGLDGNSIPDEEFKEREMKKISDLFESENGHSENSISLFEEDYFGIECTGCSNYISFKSPEEIPDKDFCCFLCDRVLIQYIGCYDHEVE